MSKTTKDPEYRERDAWIVANMAGVWPKALPECVTALRRRDERERKRGMAVVLVAAERLPVTTREMRFLKYMSGQRSMAWARKKRTPAT